MHPTNKAKRNKTFLNFLLLFIISVAIITTTIFFSIQVPFKQNRQLLTSVREGERDRDFSSEFMSGLGNISTMLDSINTKSLKPELLDAKITESIKNLSTMVEADSTYNKSLYRSIVIMMSDLQAAKKQLRDFTGKDANVDELMKQKEELGQKNYGLQQENLQLRQQLLDQQRHK